MWSLDSWTNVPDATLSLRAALAHFSIPTSAQQLALLEALRDFYTARGLLPGGTNPPLRASCELGDCCWKGLPDSALAEERGGITLPWIGRNYHKHRVLVIAHNLKNSGGLLDEQHVVSDVRRSFAEGRRKVHGTVFAYRSATAVAGLSHLNRDEIADKPDPSTLLAVLDSCSRLQAVKCSPVDGHLGLPTQTMTEHCPRQYLPDELRMLAPRKAIVLGVATRDAVTRAFSLAWTSDSGVLRSSLSLDDGECEIFYLNHPASVRHWWRTWAPYRSMLEEGRGT